MRIAFKCGISGQLSTQDHNGGLTRSLSTLEIEDEKEIRHKNSSMELELSL